MPDISSQQEVQDVISTAIDVENAVQTVETSLTTTDASAQTDMKKREMDGIMKAMTSVKEEIAIGLVKLNETNKQIADEKDKLTKTDNEDTKKQIEAKIRDLEAEKNCQIRSDKH